MAFWDYFNKAKRVVGNIYEGGKRVAKVLNTVGKVGYNVGRGIYDYVADNPFNMANYYSFNDQPQRIINPPQAPYRPPPRVLPLPPPSRQNNPPRTRSESANANALPAPPINLNDFYTPPERVSNSSSITDFLRNAKPRGMTGGGRINALLNNPKSLKSVIGLKDGGLINNRPKIKYVL